MTIVEIENNRPKVYFGQSKNLEQRAIIQIKVGNNIKLFLGVTICVVLMASAMGSVHASRNLHNSLLDKILHAPMSFFDTTPLGRILNRFSRDLDVIDSNIPVFLRGWLFVIAPLLSTCVLIIYTSPIILAVMAPLGIMYYVIQVCTFFLFPHIIFSLCYFYIPLFLHTSICF